MQLVSTRHGSCLRVAVTHGRKQTRVELPIPSCTPSRIERAMETCD